jgi:ligand-binding SRPBCC domain-containing protein
MALIYLETEIKAPIQRCFDLSRSIDLHTISTSTTNERAIAGVTGGLIGLHEEVTWRAKHLGFYQNFTSRITQFEYPNFFESTMIKGAFKSFIHKHEFVEKSGVTCMKDFCELKAPFGFIGNTVMSLGLLNYMRQLLEQRNRVIKRVAESDEWKLILA